MEYKVDVNDFYVIVSGLFVYDHSLIDENKFSENYCPWQKRVSGGNYENTFKYLKGCYYNNFCNNIFPEVNGYSTKEIRELGLVEHYTLKKVINKADDYTNWKISIKNKELKFDIKFVDLYLFPHNIGIFSIYFSLAENCRTIEDISDFTYSIRLLHSIFSNNKNNSISLKSFIEKEVLVPIEFDSDWNLYNPHLKSYIQIDLDTKQSDENRNQLLYDIANVSPLGSSKGKGGLSPSEKYYQKQIDNNLISVFSNWSAMSLFDSFVRVSSKYPDTFNSWGHEYFNIYIHALYSKFFLYLTSTKLSDVTIVNRETAKIRNEFIEFINDEIQSHVSYKFLPNYLTEKLHYSMGVNVEVENMGVKVQRINEHFQEKRENTLNIAISIIAFLSIFSSLYDFSEWGVSNGLPKEIMFPYVSISVSIITFSLIFYLILRKRK